MKIQNTTTFAPTSGPVACTIRSSVLVGPSRILDAENHDQLSLYNGHPLVFGEKPALLDKPPLRLNNATLEVTTQTALPANAVVFLVVNKTTCPTVCDNPFAGLPEGAEVDLGGNRSARITYRANAEKKEISGGSDIALYGFQTTQGAAP